MIFHFLKGFINRLSSKRYRWCRAEWNRLLPSSKDIFYRLFKKPENVWTVQISTISLSFTFYMKSAKYTNNIYNFYFLLNLLNIIYFCILIQKNVNEISRWWLSSALSSFLNFNYIYHLDSVILSENDRWYSYLSFSESITESTH